jgi:hypothetical protein
MADGVIGDEIHAAVLEPKSSVGLLASKSVRLSNGETHGTCDG